MATSTIKSNIVCGLRLGTIAPSPNTFDTLFQAVFDAMPNNENAVMGTFFYEGYWTFFGTKYADSNNGGFTCHKVRTSTIVAVSVNNGALTYENK